MKVGAEVALTNLRFADDVMLIARSLAQLRNMLDEIQEAARNVGLELYPDKTKILSNSTQKEGRPKDTHVLINDMNIEILPLDAKTNYPGREISFTHAHMKEIDNPIGQGWAKFSKF